jgi:hypothetical protein
MISGNQVSTGLKGVIAAGIMVAVSLILPPVSGQEQRPYLGPRPGAVSSNAPNHKGLILDENRLLEATIIQGVPAYLSRHGSGPTAAAMVLAYHDAHGFQELLPGDTSVQTDQVNLAIASQEHYNDYCLPLDAPPAILADKSELPEKERHPDNCLADHCLTSRSLYGNYYGQTKGIDLKPGIENFVRSGGRYVATAATYPFAQVDWTTIRNEVLSNRPMVFLMDADGDSLEDLFVTVIGFYTENDINYFGCFDTQDGDLHWHEYRQAESGVPGGVLSVHIVAVSYGVFPPVEVKLERLVNDYIFFKEYINRLTWEANPDNLGTILRYKIYRKTRGEPDTSYGLVSEVDPAVFRYDDRGLRKGAVHIYRITAVDDSGRESPPAVVRAPA